MAAVRALEAFPVHSSPAEHPRCPIGSAVRLRRLSTRAKRSLAGDAAFNSRTCDLVCVCAALECRRIGARVAVKPMRKRAA